jgi:hypothetical protein
MSNVSSISKLPIIEVSGGNLSSEVTQAEKFLITANVPFYQRGELLVRPVVQEVEAAHNRFTKVAQLINVQPAYLTDQLCQHMKWHKFDSRIGGMKAINPPNNIAPTLLSRYGQWNFPRIVGVITTPTLRPDGSILSREGYDSATRLVLMSPPKMPEIPDTPSKKDAENALGFLSHLIEGFPFVDEASRSVALSCFITPVVRGSLKVAPMHAIRASAPGSGKSYLLDVASAISTGQLCPVMSAGRTEEETEKRLGAALIAAQPIISIDNVNGTLGGDALCQIIERPVVEIRILGKSERVRIESRSTVFATGNNLCLLGDMTRRALLCTLDANMERPELRVFATNPVNEVLQDRGKYIAAILTIVRAYICAGRPSLASPLGSFEDWSDIVRSALIWLGCADPCLTLETARQEDPYLQAIISVFTELRAVIAASNPHTTKEIVRVALEKDEDSSHKYPALYEALVNVAGDKSNFIQTRELGKWFSRHKGRIVCGLRLDSKTNKNGHAATWWLTDMNC